MSNLIQIINHPNHIVEVRLNRPDKRNAMSFALLRELLKIGEELQEQREIRAVILTGERQVIIISCRCPPLKSKLPNEREPKKRKRRPLPCKVGNGMTLRACTQTSP